MDLNQIIKAYEFSLQKKHLKAIKIYKRLFEMDKQYWIAEAISNAYHKLGVDKNDYSAFLKAVEWIDVAIRLNPNNADLYYQLAFLHELHVLDEEKAADAIEKSFSINPDHREALALAASFHGHPDHSVSLEEAIGYQERLVGISPNDPWVFLNLARLYKEAGRIQDAKLCWAKALSLQKKIDHIKISDIKKRTKALGEEK